MVFSVVSMKSEFIINNIEHTLYNIFPLVLFYLIVFGVSTFLGKLFFNKKDSLALIFGTSLRHLSIALAVSVSAFGEDGLRMALIISLAFVLQVKIGAIYIKIVDKIFK
jgi:ACR3 family arsenite efflux pump ArsB